MVKTRLALAGVGLIDIILKKIQRGLECIWRFRNFFSSPFYRSFAVQVEEYSGHWFCTGLGSRLSISQHFPKTLDILGVTIDDNLSGSFQLVGSFQVDSDLL